MKPLNKFFDHTLLKPDATRADIEKLCEEARKYQFYSVCVNSCFVRLAGELLKDTGIEITAVVGFPLGAMETSAKAFEADIACTDGAGEIDMVINIGAIKEGNFDIAAGDIAAVASICSDHDAVLKVIIETCLLTDDEIIRACETAEEAGADFVKTSTGFAKSPDGSPGGATVNAVKLMRSAVSEDIKIKASGGIHTLAEASALIEAGADRLGCSASARIMEEHVSYLT
jgi:deoxyribose-phosphate aldolase